MKKRVLSIILCVIMLCSLLPTAALAVEGVPDVQYINVTGGTEQEPTFGFGDLGENTMAVYISGSGDYEVADDFSGIATIINDTAVTIEGGAVNTEDVYIFGEGSLTVGDVTFTSGHEIELSDDTVDAIFGAVMTEGSDVVDISGTITAGTELVVRNAIISGALEFAAGFEEVESGHLTISGGGSLTVEKDATATAAQDARITALSGVTIKGIALYDADTSTKLSDVNDSYTVEAEVENFIWLENGENSESIQKWVLMVDGGEGGESVYTDPEQAKIFARALIIGFIICIYICFIIYYIITFCSIVTSILQFCEMDFAILQIRICKSVPSRPSVLGSIIVTFYQHSDFS